MKKKSFRMRRIAIEELGIAFSSEISTNVSRVRTEYKPLKIKQESCAI